MKSIYVFCFLTGLSLTFGCKNDASSKQEETISNSQQENSPAPVATPSGNQVASTSTSGHDFTILTDKIFIYKQAYGGKNTREQPYKDEWIDLTSDGKFRAGKLKEQTHTGTWTYIENSKTLHLTPDDSKFKNTEWTIMYNNQMMVWVGTETYGDNAIQVQLVRVDKLPF